MAEREKSFIPGAVLIIIGVVFLFNELNIFNFRWRYLYPILMLGGSALFFVSMFTKKEKGAIFPATVLLILGLFFALRNFDIFSFDYYFYYVQDFWPIFLVAFGSGFVALFFVRSEDWGVLIPGGVLLFLGMVFFLRNSGFIYWQDFADYWPVVLIIIGLSVVLSSLRKKT
ncbi:MAG: hypothetical protein E2O76_11850 [Caldithrix sp.]|nr:MAG: hypothetical protein E2O76_11850 [Caldithrix sp.]